MSQTPDPDYRASRGDSFEAGTPGREGQQTETRGGSEDSAWSGSAPGEYATTAEPGYFASETPPPASSDPTYVGAEPADLGYASEPGGTSSTGDTAKDEAGQVKDTVAGAGQQVAGTAKDEAKNVAAEGKNQAKSLLNQAGSEVSAQASTQQQRVAGLVQGYASELESMVSGSSESGALTDLAAQASRKVSEAGSWLESHEPRELVDELTRFARRRPVAFLVGAGVAGAVAGRLTRGLAANAKDEHDEATAVSTPEYTPAPAPSYTPTRSLVDEAPTAVAESEPTSGYADVPPTSYSDTPGASR